MYTDTGEAPVCSLHQDHLLLKAYNYGERGSTYGQNRSTYGQKKSTYGQKRSTYGQTDQ